MINEFDTLVILSDEFENNSVLKNSFEIEYKKKILLIDTLIGRANQGLITRLYSFN